MSKKDSKELPAVYDLYERLIRNLTGDNAILNISQQFVNFENNKSRVDYVYNLLKKYGLLPPIRIENKDDSEGLNWRQKGNEFFKRKQLSEAVESYSKSAAFCPTGSENLALAFGNRSAVHIEKSKMKACIVDIDLALSHDCPQKIKEKLLLRKEKASKTSQIAFRPYYCEIPTFPIENRNENIPCASSSIEIKESDEEGRFIVAKKDIEIGEILAVEKSFSHVLINGNYRNCHNCFELSDNLLPCPSCTEAMFCSKHCLDYAFKNYHNFECPILHTIREMKFDDCKVVPLRILLQCSQDDLKEALEDNNDNEYRSNRYKEIHRLVANTTKRSMTDFFHRAVYAAVVFHLVETGTDYFLQNRLSKDQFKDLVLLHMQTSACNFHEIFEQVLNPAGVYEGQTLGAAAYSFLSMFNHSCSPNVTRICYGTTGVIRAITEIKCGEKIFDNYGCHFAVMDKATRQSKLKKQYYFDCNCVACVDNYPLHVNLPMGTVSKRNEEKIFKIVDEMQKCSDFKIAENHIKDIIKIMQSFDDKKLTQLYCNLQEILKQCFFVLGNLRL